jgi:hypothetical protein
VNFHCICPQFDAVNCRRERDNIPIPFAGDDEMHARWDEAEDDPCPCACHEQEERFEDGSPWHDWDPRELA